MMGREGERDGTVMEVKRWDAKGIGGRWEGKGGGIDRRCRELRKGKRDGKGDKGKEQNLSQKVNRK